MCPSQENIASHQNYSKTIPKCVLAKVQLHLIEINPNRIPNCVLAKTLLHLIEIILGQFQTNCLVAEIQLHLIEIILRPFQKVS